MPPILNMMIAVNTHVSPWAPKVPSPDNSGTNVFAKSTSSKWALAGAKNAIQERRNGTHFEHVDCGKHACVRRFLVLIIVVVKILCNEHVQNGCSPG